MFVWRPNTDVEMGGRIDGAESHPFCPVPRWEYLMAGLIFSDRGAAGLYVGFIFIGFGSSPFDLWLKSSQARAVLYDRSDEAFEQQT